MHRHDLNTGVDRTFPVSGMPAAIGLAQGGLIVAFRNGLAKLDTTAGAETRIETDIDFSHERFNDGKVDRQGRFFVGSMDKSLSAPVGGLWRIDPDYSVTRIAEGVTLGNGIEWSPDDRTLYFCDSRRGLIRAYDFDVSCGTVSNERIHVDFRDTQRRPDGCAMDAEGCLWVAEMPSDKIGRYDPDGRRIGEIVCPVTRVTSLAFYGPDLRSLCVTSMSHGHSPDEALAQPMAGRTFVLSAGLRGLEVGTFGG